LGEAQRSRRPEKLHPGLRAARHAVRQRISAVATVKVGPVKTRWKGKVRLSDFDPPNSYRISGEGDGGVAGFAKGAAKVSLADNDGGTLLSYNVESQIGAISSKNSELPSQRTHRPHRHVDKSVAEAPWWCLATGASNAQLPVRTKNQTSCDDRHQTSAQNADGPR
jgi:hypothetical protein